ncbi:toll/interleukin-1 receptor domain-containing protein [Pseudenhygromyxa sp. WMMC2535]|uniref:toll/interleukin-1 receptor domain-containing protein n=1 Tax=Pseudenhygromyxa sp. WMMC2535 TaxID=2712867 RepID=UPI001556136A|nr:toll/interleukin-1 receptor domain-containing protein [Pseudenhygromyxa sp. WMMC2535]NVB38405.1 toll/interleukin-1 receptor domain-containing protein [Pseudenhygromyxa sp. WMMC2535]
MLHSLRVDGPNIALQKYRNENPDEDRRPGGSPDFPTILRGHIEYIGHVRGHDDRWYLKFARGFSAPQPNAKFRSQFVSEKPRDVFFCHASEDKSDVVEPLNRECKKLGLSCWYDKQDIKWGDGLIRNIDRGLSTSKIVVVVVSDSFAKKPWPLHEMEAATVLELEHGEVFVLPLFVGLEAQIRTLRRKFPMLLRKLSFDMPRPPPQRRLLEAAQQIQSRLRASDLNSAVTP